MRFRKTQVEGSADECDTESTHGRGIGIGIESSSNSNASVSMKCPKRHIRRVRVAMMVCLATMGITRTASAFAFTPQPYITRHINRHNNMHPHPNRHRHIPSEEMDPNTNANANTISKTKRASTALHGIRGFRSWFESQFPNAMTTIQHPHRIKSKPRQHPYQSQSQPQSPNQFQSETFHHVLIDMNQLLHVTLRRSRSEGHALTLLIQELDKCTEIATPTKSIVLAFDGPPAAAKLATQRRRRYGTVVRSERKKNRFEMLKKRGVLPINNNNNNNHNNHNGNANHPAGGGGAGAGGKSGGRGNRNKRNKRKRDKAEKEEETLKITPGTEFMEKAHEAVLYWAWQRLDNPRGRLARCRIYICPSDAPGEGEVKLLDWLIQAGSEERVMTVFKENGQMEKERLHHSSRIVKPGESVAILGGDSDLVLEGLVIPPTITHNVFVILPAGGKTSYVISLWETTLTLGKYLGENFDAADIMRVRTDLVLLLIMNGNDYLPKLRGSAGFNKLFHTYLRLLKSWLKEEKDQPPYLVDPNGRMEFNLPFCITYFKILASMAPKHMVQPSDMIPNHKSITPLSQLYSMVDAGFLPQPAEFERVRIPKNEEKEILRLTLGQEESNNKISYDLEHRISERPMKKTKQILANMALEDLLGKDYMDLNDYYVGGKGDDDESNADDDDFDWVDPIVDGIYSWEVNIPAASNVDEYLKGLLWNLATYQDGVCSDYGYNYGRRMSPTAEEVAAYFERAQKRKRRVDRASLLGDEFVLPLNAGLSCLAALPSQVDNLIPQPYQQLSADNKVEDIFGQCMDPETNVFDMALFQDLCLDAIREMDLRHVEKKKKKPSSRRSNLRKIRTGDTFWTVISRVKNPLPHPFEPPPPFSDRLSYLRFNPCIKARHIIARSRPRWLSNEEAVKGSRKKNGDKRMRTTNQSDMGGLLVNALGDDTCLEDVGYKTVYQSSQNEMVNTNPQPKNKVRSNEVTPKVKEASTVVFEDETLDYEIKKMKKYGLKLTEPPVLNTENFNALQCLQQLNDANLIRDLSWDYESPSKSNYASENPAFYEEVKVSFKIQNIGTFELRQDRNHKFFPRKLIKHTIASDAMSKVFGQHGDWSRMRIKDLKSILDPEPVTTSVDELSALQCLHQLKDADCFDLTWTFLTQSEAIEYVILSIKGSNMEIRLEESRNIYQDTKASLKHRLATGAMERITQGSKLDWKSMTISELRDHLTIQSSA